MKRALFVVLFFSSLVAYGHIQGEHQLGSIGGVSEEYLSSPVEILVDVGTYPELEMTSSLPPGVDRDETLLYTQQGLALNHAFQWEDAVRSFYEALNRDPQMARAYLGLSQSFTMLNRDSSKLNSVLTDLVRKAQTAALAVSENEVDRLWIDLLNVFYQAQYGISSSSLISQTGKSLASSSDPMAKIQALAIELMQAYNDPEVYAFIGWDLGQEQVLKAGYQQFPTHTGILHYLVHTTENTGRYQEAVRYADEMVKIAPEAPHLVHMYGHVLPMIGKWKEASEWLLRSHCLHEAVLHANNPLCAGIEVHAAMSPYTPKSEEFWHYSHNLELYGFSLMRIRDLTTAEIIFEERCRVGDCSSLFQFYFGEKMYDKVLQKLTTLGPLSVDQKAMRVQALAMTGDLNEAKTQFMALPKQNSLEILSAGLVIAFADKNVAALQDQQLGQLIDNATFNPNFDSWSHLLPVLRKLHNFAAFYQADETQEIYDAIQKIDPGHPL